MRVPRNALALSASFLLASCGGGGGGGTSLVAPPGGTPAVFVPGVAYLADAEVFNKVELFTAAVDGSEFRKVSAALPDDGDVLEFAWSPDRQLLAYLARASTSAPARLFVVSLFGGSATDVSAGFGASESVAQFEWSPTSLRLAFTVRTLTTSKVELWSVTVAGAATRLHPPFPDDRFVVHFAWSPDGAHVAYVANPDAEFVPELFAAPAAGGPVVRLSGPMVSGGGIDLGPSLYISLVFRDDIPFHWSPDAARVAYTARQDDADINDVYVSNADGTGNVRVSSGIALGGGAFAVQWAPDGSRVAYLAVIDDPDPPVLRSVLPTGGGEAALSLAADGERNSLRFAWSPDSTHVAFVGASSAGGSEATLLVTPSTGGGVLDITLPLVILNGLSMRDVQWSADSSWVSVIGGFPATSLMVGRPDGSGMSLVATGDILSSDLAPDGSRWAYVSAPFGGRPEVFVTPFATDYGAIRVSPSLGLSHGARVAHWSSDGTRVLYTIDLDGLDVYGVFASSPDGTSTVRVSGPLVLGGQVTAFAVR